MLSYTLVFDREVDGRWIGEVPDLPGCLSYGSSQEEAERTVMKLALEIIADRVGNGEISVPAALRFDRAA
jgi:predicted RNase H-like HicB family nuclease